MINLLVGIIIFLALVQPSRDRAVAALCFAIPTFVHLIAFSDEKGMPSDYYYHVAGFADLCVIMCLSKLIKINRFTMSLIYISMLFFITNFIGYMMYLSYQEPDLYNYLSISLYIATVVCLLHKDTVNGRSSSVVNRNRNLFGNWGKGLLQLQISEKAVK